MNLVLVTPPLVEPVTLRDVYDHLRLTPTGDSPPSHPHDAMLTRHIATARGEAETITRRAFVEQTWRLILDSFPGGCGTYFDEGWTARVGSGWIELPKPPLLSVGSVKYYDADNALQTVSDDDYYVTDELVPRLCFTSGFSAPSTYERPDALRIEYVVGYEPYGYPEPDSTANIPSQIKDAVLIGVKLLYDADSLTPQQRESFESARSSLLSSFEVVTL